LKKIISYLNAKNKKAVRNDGFFVLCPRYVRCFFRTGKKAGNMRQPFPLSVIGQAPVSIDHFGSFQSQAHHHILLIYLCAEYRRSVAMPLIMYPESALCFGQGYESHSVAVRARSVGTPSRAS